MSTPANAIAISPTFSPASSPSPTPAFHKPNISVTPPVLPALFQSPTTSSTASSLPLLSPSSLSLLRAHSLSLSSQTNHFYILASFSYLLFNLLRNYYHDHSHYQSLLFLSDAALFATNITMLLVAIAYWVSYAEMTRCEWETDRLRKAAADSEKEITEDEGESEVDALLQGEIIRTPSSPTLPHSTSSSYASGGTSAMSATLSHVLRSFVLTLLLSPAFYLSGLGGIAELINVSGAFLYFLSSTFPLVPSGVALLSLPPLHESTEAMLDELTYMLDGVAMLLYVAGALLYFHLWARSRRAAAGLTSTSLFSAHASSSSASASMPLSRLLAELLLDGNLWAQLWNIAGSICYFFSVLYGLSIRIHTAEQEHLQWTEDASFSPETTVSSSPLSSAAESASSNSTLGLIAADDLSDLTEWQRALFHLTASQRLMMSMGDLMYSICAVMTEVAERQEERRRRGRGKKSSRRRRHEKEADILPPYEGSSAVATPPAELDSAL